MRVAVVGATGGIGSRVVDVLARTGHDGVPIARSEGVDARTGEGLGEALTGVEAVIDVSNTPDLDPSETRSFFGEITANLLQTGRTAGVRHHVALSIVGVDRVENNGHYAGKRHQEDLVRGCETGWTILRATQFFDFPAMVAEWTTSDGSATLPPLLVQPVAPGDVAERLVELAVAAPVDGVVEMAGPDTHDFVDMARRTFQARGESRGIRASWRDQPFGVEMAGEVLLPGTDAALTTTTFDQWLDAGAQ